MQKAEIDQGVGDVAASGTKQVCPAETTQYMITATGTGGTVYRVGNRHGERPGASSAASAASTGAGSGPGPGRVVIDRLTIHVNFDFDKSNIRKADVAEMEKATAFLKKYPDSKVVLVGHTDSVGTVEYNLKLSQRRADAVKKYLVDKGHEKADRITTEAKGKSEPIASNKTAKGRFENRRVEILIIGD